MYGRKLGVVIGMIILGGWFGSSWAIDLKIGYVDITRAVNECREGIEAKKVIVKELEKYQRLGAEKQKELQAMKDSLEKQALMLTPDARVTKEKEFQNKGREFQRWVEDSQNEIKSERGGDGKKHHHRPSKSDPKNRNGRGLHPRFGEE